MSFRTTSNARLARGARPRTAAPSPEEPHSTQCVPRGVPAAVRSYGVHAHLFDVFRISPGLRRTTRCGHVPLAPSWRTCQALHRLGGWWHNMHSCHRDLADTLAAVKSSDRAQDHDSWQHSTQAFVRKGVAPHAQARWPLASHIMVSFSRVALRVSVSVLPPFFQRVSLSSRMFGLWSISQEALFDGVFVFMSGR